MSWLFPRTLGRLPPKRFRELLENKGPTFVKIGQYLALRPDLIPQEYCDELINLLDKVPPFPWPEARAILRAELGDDPEDVFEFIDSVPVAAGSLAQVHRARLHDGSEVAVKVQRPDIRARVLHDLKQVRLLKRLLRLSGITLLVPAREVIAELRGWMLQEIDFRRELFNIKRLRHLMADSPIARIPRPYPRYCTGRVLTIEFLEGIRFTELITRRRAGQEIDVDIDALARNLQLATLEQVFTHQFFHADQHPGNLLALPDNKVGFVDFGLCDRLDDVIRQSQLRYVTAVYTGDARAMYKALTDILIAGKDTDMEAFRADFLEETRKLQSGTQADGADGRAPERSPFGYYLIALMQSARRHGLKVPARVLALYRTLLTVETVVRRMGSGVGLQAVGREFLTRLQVEDVFSQVFDFHRLLPFFINLLNLTRDAPRQLNQILNDVADGSFTIKVDANEAPKVTWMRNRRTRLVTAAILSVSVTFLLTLPDLPAVFGMSLAWPLGAVLLFLYLQIFLLWRRLD